MAITEKLVQELRSAPEYIKCIGYDQNNPYHYLPLDLHMQLAEEETERMVPLADRLILAAMLHDIGKPDCMTIDGKTGVCHFFGHAKKSAEIAERLLRIAGMSKESSEIVCWYIRHHDDFISFGADAPKDHPFMRTVTRENVAEVILKSLIAINGKDKDINATVRSVITGTRPAWGSQLPWKPLEFFVPACAFHNLLVLCKADAMAQSKSVVKPNGEILTREERLYVLDRIEDEINNAYTLAVMRLEGIRKGVWP